jgi:hypothetical protein
MIRLSNVHGKYLPSFYYLETTKMYLALVAGVGCEAAGMVAAVRCAT